MPKKKKRSTGKSRRSTSKSKQKYILIIAVVVIGLIILFLIFNGSEKSPGSNDSDSSAPEEEKIYYSSTQNGVTFELEDFTFVKTKEDYGILTDITISITNAGVENINPLIYILIYDDDFTGKYKSEKRIELSQPIEASTGMISHLKLPVDLGIGGIGINKNFKITLYDDITSSYIDTAITSIEFKTNFLDPDKANQGELASLF